MRQKYFQQTLLLIGLVLMVGCRDENIGEDRKRHFLIVNDDTAWYVDDTLFLKDTVQIIDTIIVKN